MAITSYRNVGEKPCTVYPPYDGVTTARWAYGLGGVGGAAGTRISPGASNLSTAGWFIAMLPLTGFQPMSFSIPKMGFRTEGAAAANADKMVFGIYKRLGTAWTLVTSYDMTSQVTFTDTTTFQNITFTAPITFSITQSDINAGYTYYAAFSIHCPVGRTASSPATRGLTTGSGPQGQSNGYYWFWDVTKTNLQTAGIPLTLADSDATTISNDLAVNAGFSFDTNAIKIQSIPTCYAGADAYYMTAYRDAAVPADGPTTHTCLTNLVVKDGSTLTMVFNTWSGVVSAISTMIWDLGDTNQVTYNAISVALGADEVAQKTDVIIPFRRPISTAVTKSNVYFMNKVTGRGGAGSSDFTWRGHAQVAGGRGAIHQVSGSGSVLPIFVKISATDVTSTIGTLEVTSRVQFVFGDSQVAINAVPGTNDLVLQLLGAAVANAAWTLPRVTRPLATNSAAVTTSIAGQSPLYLRYNNGTPGNGDLIDMYSVDFIWCGASVGDSNLLITGGTSDSRNTIKSATIADVIQKLGGIATSIMTSNSTSKNRLFIIALPPHPSSATAELGAYPRDFGMALRGFAAAYKCAFYDPYDLVNANVATYLNGDGLHYTDTGAAAVAAAFVSLIEANIGALFEQ